MILHDFFRSSAAYRVRLAVNIKGISVRQQPLDMYRDGGEHKMPGYTAKNPLKLVPTLELDDGRALPESLAIIEYLDATQGGARLIPDDPWEAARVRAASYAIACDIHPLNNLRVLQYLEHELGQGKAAIQSWYEHWVREGGLLGFQDMIGKDGPYCFGDQLSMADCCLIPQLFNARRLNVPLDGLDRLVAIETACNDLPAFKDAQPSVQPGAF
ncbi:maleylacetoacetate isomerase [Zhengella mangrovi]|uniref:Maleylacetoacetate isomerase n=1 Tax=Zhengella mangrovi TaxID=1982044 RepID=A0A2G1QMV4_9HYPH|nr:maleylacetoacetate isomerase [Zhengella mangrovi]PHP66780.1 maleylacetoacetate isomerase [Zhengella mangrovi]